MTQCVFTYCNADFSQAFTLSAVIYTLTEFDSYSTLNDDSEIMLTSTTQQLQHQSSDPM